MRSPAFNSLVPFIEESEPVSVFVRLSLIPAFALLMAGLPAWAVEMDTPDPALAPGVVSSKVTQANISETICSPKWVAKAKPARRYTDTLKKQQIRAWEYTDRTLKNYVEDHVVPLELGGHPTDPGNLWPQSTKLRWNAATKDKLEEYVNREVCAGRMTLKEGQSVFRKGWVEVFHLYCGADPSDVCTMPGSPVLLENVKPVIRP